MKITDWCTGCRACEFRCSQRCIQLKPNHEGFLTAWVDDVQCIECGVCVEICPQNNQPDSQLPNEVWAARIKDDRSLQGSASGGAFTAIARTILEQGGVVYGAAYDKHLKVCHIQVDSLPELERLQGSKYVQSDAGDTFREVKKLLEQGRIVFYSGTPCQIAGLKSYLGKKQKGLLTADLICHGVPSPQLFATYLSWLEKKSGEEILHYDFRNKQKGWGLGFYAIYGTKGKSWCKPASFDPYYLYFLKGASYRECCYRCCYATQKRISDFTIGDYWGIEKEHPAFFSTNGVSLLLLNSLQSLKWMEAHKGLFFLQSSTFEKAAAHNRNLFSPTFRPLVRETIYEGINELSSAEYFKYKFPLNPSIKNMMTKMLPVGVKKLLKKIDIIFLTRT